MATWFSVVARIASTEGIADSIYQNALCEFPEGTRNTEPESEDSWRGVFISFYGDLLQAGKNYIIFGSARLPANTDTDMPLFTANDAIPYLTDNLPVHQLRIHAAAELLTQPRFDDATRTWEFEASVTGFYADPAPEHLRHDKRLKAAHTQTKSQYVYCEDSPKFSNMLRSKNVRPRSQIFVAGDYTFAIPAEQQSSYIDLLSLSFVPAANRIGPGTLGSAPTISGSSRRRNVPVKASPTATSNSMRPPTTPQGRRSVASTSSAPDIFTAASSGNMTPGSSTALGDDDELGWEFGTHGLSEDSFSGIGGSNSGGGSTQAGVMSSNNLQKKRPATEPAMPESSKRPRKPSTKAKERDGDNA